MQTFPIIGGGTWVRFNKNDAFALDAAVTVFGKTAEPRGKEQVDVWFTSTRDARKFIEYCE